MNIHPIFVHFPIALLTVYAFMEILRFKKFTNQPYFFYVKACFLIAGSLTSFLALQTGELAEQALGRSNLIETHSTYADISSNIFAFLAVIYLISWISKTEWNTKLQTGKMQSVWIKLVSLVKNIEQSIFPILLAIIGLITITITGALGGAIVYGPDIDPVVKMIYSLVM